MVGVARRLDKVEALVEGLGCVALCMNPKHPNAGDVRGLQRAKHGVLEEAATEALALPGGRSIAIQIGGIGGLAPTRKSDLARMGMRAVMAGTMANFMSACIAGMLL